MKTGLIRARDFVRSIALSDRQAVGLFVLSASLFAVLTVLWLSVSTRTALSNRDLDKLTERETDLQQQINSTWTDIGNATSAERMETRARQLGFSPPSRVEHLVAATAIQASAALTSTTLTTATVAR